MVRTCGQCSCCSPICSGSSTSPCSTVTGKLLAIPLYPFVSGPDCKSRTPGGSDLTYDTIFSDGYPWNTVTPRGDYVPDHAAVASKAAIGMWALWETEYTDVLFEAIADLYDPEIGMYEGLYERGQGRVEIFTANNNGIILAAFLYKVQGPILTAYTGETEVWYTAFREQSIRQDRNYPDPPTEADWLPAIRHSTYNRTQ